MAIVGRLVNLCWYWFRWTCVLVVAGALLVAVWTYHRFNDEVRQRVETLLARQYPHLVVTVRAAQVVDGEGINIRGLAIFDPESAGPPAQLCYVDELFLACETDWQTLLTGQVNVSHLVIRNPTLRLTLRADGGWSLGKLLPLPAWGGACPTADIENGTIEVIAPERTPATTLALRGAHLRAAPRDDPNTPGQRTLHVAGQLTGDFLRRANIELTLDPASTGWHLGGTFEGLELSPELIATLPGDLPRKLEPLRPVRAVAQGRFQVERRLVSKTTADGNTLLAAEYRFDTSGQVVRGRIDDPRLPYPLTDLRAAFRATHDGLWLDELVGRHGQATVRMSLERPGYTQHAPMRVDVRVERLSLDRKLVDILPESVVTEWHKYLPAGEIDLDLKLAYDGRNWQTELIVRLLNVAFTYHRFPYRLERGSGTLTLKQQKLGIDLVAYSHTEPVRVVGQFHFDQPEAYGQIEVRGQNLRIDEKLLVALDERPRQLLRSFRPYGAFNLNSRFWRAPGDTGFHRELHLGLNRCSIRFDKFAYPLDELRGTIELHDDHWLIRNLQGANDAGLVTCNGQVNPTADGGLLTLHFTGTNIALESELRDALSPAARQLWNDLKPRGSIHLETELQYDLGSHEQSLWVRAEPVDDSVSIEPSYFAYRLDELRGTFVYHDGQVLLQNLRARHQNTTLSAQGLGTLATGEGWQLRLERLAVDRLAVDRDLLQAVPERLRRLLGDLRPSGLFNLRGSLALAGGRMPGQPVTAEWQTQIDFSGNSLHCGIPLEHLHGGMTVAGVHDGHRTWSAGELKIDSLIHRQLQFTNVMGPLWIDDEAALAGVWAQRKQGSAETRHLTANLLGGTLVADAWVSLGEPQPRFAVQASLAQADLAQVAREFTGSAHPVRGKLFAEVELRGIGASTHGLSGYGTVKLRDADIYQLPSMVQLLKLLSVRPPDATAFTESDADFRIEGEHIYIDRIDFNGDAISLRGVGEMNFNTELRLAFHALVGRTERQFPVLRDLLGGASQQIMLIHVDGTLAQPTIRREAFPVVNQALQQIQAELNGPPGSVAPLAAPPPAGRR